MSLDIDEIRACWEQRGGWVDFTRGEIDELARLVAADGALERCEEERARLEETLRRIKDQTDDSDTHLIACEALRKERKV